MSHSHQLAPIIRRFIAFILDFALLGAVICAFLFVYMGKPEIEPNADEGKISIADKYQFFTYAEAIAEDSDKIGWIKRFASNYPLGALMIFLIPFLYWSIFEGMWGATIGKLIIGIRVRNKAGMKISWGTSFTRAFVKLLSVGIFFLGCLIALFDKKSQALHDKIANTLVVKR
ncbi:MAG: RDD family protein [Fimbriimonadaceae bacterium]|nr:RDD family protein [Chitinophagales bacterium]